MMANRAQWLERSKTCPTCREALEPEQLKKERNIGCLINDLEVRSLNVTLVWIVVRGV
jgi:hypothetical protein